MTEFIIGQQGIGMPAIIIIFSMAGRMATYLNEKGNESLAHRIPKWIAEVFKGKVTCWIADKRGWETVLKLNPLYCSIRL